MIVAGPLPLKVRILFRRKVIAEIMELSNVGSVEDDYSRLTGNLMRELSKGHKRLPTDFGIEDIHTIAALGVLSEDA
jgi:hypothetical protein